MSDVAIIFAIVAVVVVLFVTERVPVVFVLTAILGQLISNTATALIIFPIAVAAAHQIGVSPRPVLMSVNVAAAAAFLTLSPPP